MWEKGERWGNGREWCFVRSTSIRRQKATFNKNASTFSELIMRNAISEQLWPAIFSKFRPDSNWVPCACVAHVMTTALRKNGNYQAKFLGLWPRCGVFLCSFPVNKTTNARFCAGSKWDPCACKTCMMTATLQKTLQDPPVLIIQKWLKIHSPDHAFNGSFTVVSYFETIEGVPTCEVRNNCWINCIRISFSVLN